MKYSNGNFEKSFNSTVHRFYLRFDVKTNIHPTPLYAESKIGYR